MRRWRRWSPNTGPYLYRIRSGLLKRAKLTSSARETTLGRWMRRRQNCKKFNAKENGPKSWRTAISFSLLRKSTTQQRKFLKSMSGPMGLANFHSLTANRSKSKDRCLGCAIETIWLPRLLAGLNSVKRKTYLSTVTRPQIIWMGLKRLIFAKKLTIR